MPRASAASAVKPQDCCPADKETAPLQNRRAGRVRCLLPRAPMTDTGGSTPGTTGIVLIAASLTGPRAEAAVRFSEPLGCTHPTLHSRIQAGPVGAGHVSISGITSTSRRWRSACEPRRAHGTPATSQPRQPHPGCARGRGTHLAVGADDDFPQVVVHGRHGLTDRVQRCIHLSFHAVPIGQQLHHLHHHLGPEERG